MRGGRKLEELVPRICVLFFSKRVCGDSKPESFVGVASTLKVGCSVLLGLAVLCVSTNDHCEIAICCASLWALDLAILCLL